MKKLKLAYRTRFRHLSQSFPTCWPSFKTMTMPIFFFTTSSDSSSSSTIISLSFLGPPSPPTMMTSSSPALTSQTTKLLSLRHLQIPPKSLPTTKNEKAWAPAQRLEATQEHLGAVLRSDSGHYHSTFSSRNTFDAYLGDPRRPKGVLTKFLASFWKLCSSWLTMPRSNERILTHYIRYFARILTLLAPVPWTTSIQPVTWSAA